MPPEHKEQKGCKGRAGNRGKCGKAGKLGELGILGKLGILGELGILGILERMLSTSKFAKKEEERMRNEEHDECGMMRVTKAV